MEPHLVSFIQLAVSADGAWVSHSAAEECAGQATLREAVNPARETRFGTLRNLRFFSGLKTAVLNEVNKAQMKGEAVNVPDLAASFQERIAGILAEKLLLAAADTGAKQVCLAGGVAANGRLRQLVNDGAQKLGAKVYLPELKFCGDNGAMIAAQGYYQYIAGHTAGLELNGLPTLPIDYE
jgi:N6-L-threonylcarbamoyladenine synthase